MYKNLLLIAVLLTVPFFATLTGCKKEEPATSSAVPGANDHGHDHGPGGDHSQDKPASSGVGHGGPVIALGEQTIGSFHAKATRDQGEIVAGKDAPIDVTVTPVSGATVKAVAVRFWIGTENARGSVKARAEIEDPSDPNRWHTHAEIPNPLPAGSALWVEIEDDKGGTSIGSFDLKM